jgi:nucleotide-binding universal stress UspA family protein
MSDSAGTVRAVLAFDGSDHARRAVDHAGRVLPGATTALVTVWESFARLAARHGVAGPLAATAVEDADKATRETAARLAEEGAQLARQAGLAAHAEPVESEDGVWRAIVAVAERRNADVIVVGARGRGDIASAILGSVTHDLLGHSPRPVLVVPPRR